MENIQKLVVPMVLIGLVSILSMGCVENEQNSDIECGYVLVTSDCSIQSFEMTESGYVVIGEQNDCTIMYLDDHRCISDLEWEVYSSEVINDWESQFIDSSAYTLDFCTSVQSDNIIILEMQFHENFKTDQYRKVTTKFIEIRRYK